MYRYVGNNATNYTDPTGELIQIPLLGLAVGGAILGGLFASAYGIADHFEHGGSVGNIDLGDIAQKGSIGAAAGATFATVGALAATGFLLAGVAESTVILGGQFIGAAGTVWQTGVGIYNATHGKPYTGFVDLVGAGLGVKGLVDGHQGYLQAVAKENAAAQAKIATLNRIGAQLDDMAAENQGLIRQIDDLQTGSTTADQLFVFGVSDTSHNLGRITGATGPISGRTYNETQIGIPIKSSSLEKVRINHRGIDKVQNHTNKFNDSASPYNPSNDYMIRRLRIIADGEINATKTDLAYYTHELKESFRYKRLGFPDHQPSGDAGRMLWNNTHSATLEDFRVRDKDILFSELRLINDQYNYFLDGIGTDKRPVFTHESIKNPSLLRYLTWKKN